MKKNLLALSVAAVLTACGGGGGAPTQTAPVVAPVSGPVVFIGDSITYRWQTMQFAAGEELPAYIVDVGISGQTSAEMLARFDTDVLALHPALVHILAGTNDCRAAAAIGASVPSFDSVREMIAHAQAHGAQVIVGTVPPAPDTYAEYPGWTELVIAWNEEVRLEAPIYGYTVAEYYAPLQVEGSLLSDDIHPSVDGYARMLHVVTPLLPSTTL